MTYHIIIDTGNSMIQHQDNSDSITRNVRRIKSVELIFLNEQIEEGTISMNPKHPLGSNLYINPQTGEPYYPLFSITWLDALSLALDKIGIANEQKKDDLPTTAVVVTLADENDNALSEFDSVVAAARKVQSDDPKGNWSFRTFHASIDSVTIAAEMSETNHFITLFEKREVVGNYLVRLNKAISEYNRNI